MKQQTAVEWVVWQLNQIIDDIPLDKWDAISVIVKRAKQMEVEQISQAWNDGNLVGRNGMVFEDYSNCKQYYEKTYK